jgi:hypothetical protein
MITERAYSLAQQRGFAGGSPIEDWLEAEKHIDAQYQVDYFGGFIVSDPAGMLKQLKKGLSVLRFKSVDTGELVERHQGSIEALIEVNQRVIVAAESLVDHEIDILHGAIAGLTTSVGEFPEQSLDECAPRQGELIDQAVGIALQHMRDLADGIMAAYLEGIRSISNHVTEARKETNEIAQEHQG